MFNHTTKYSGFLSVVAVLHSNGKGSDFLESTLSGITEVLSNIVNEYELIIIDNASEDDAVKNLKKLASSGHFSNLHVYALAQEVSFDTASWAGIENSIGDFIAVIDFFGDEISFLPAMLKEAVDGADIVCADNKSKSAQGIFYSIAHKAFNFIYRCFSGIHLPKKNSRYKIINKKVLNFILRHRVPLITYRYLSAVRGFTKVNLVYDSPLKTSYRRSLIDSINHGLRLITLTTNSPLRLVTILSLFGAISNLLYSFYVIGIYLFKENVAPGWLTLSMQQSGMFFLISLVLLVLGEYILNITSLSNEVPLYSVAHKFGSVVKAGSKKLNVEENENFSSSKKPNNSAVNYDAVVIGGGFYGASVAQYLASKRGLKKVLLVEREAELLSRASCNNQSRIHGGYHYPRSFLTGLRSHINFPYFLNDYEEAIEKNFTNLYAIAKNGSNISAKQFESFCREIGAKLEPASQSAKQLFEPRMIEEVFQVEEHVFNVDRLRKIIVENLQKAGVEVILNQEVKNVGVENDRLICEVNDEKISARYFFNCTYSGLNQFNQNVGAELKHEIAELALMKMPQNLSSLGITVLDGAFFSLMPFPSQNLHSLSHVNYTPHLSWIDKAEIDPYKKLAEYSKESLATRMIRDAARYVPALEEAKYIKSLFEVKTLLVKNENDDGRPIFLEQHAKLPGFYSILGGKIDNVYDVLERLDKEKF